MSGNHAAKISQGKSRVPSDNQTWQWKMDHIWRFKAGKHIERNGDFAEVTFDSWRVNALEVSIPWFFRSQARPSSRVPKIRQQLFFFFRPGAAYVQQRLGGS